MPPVDTGYVLETGGAPKEAQLDSPVSVAPLRRLRDGSGPRSLRERLLEGRGWTWLRLATDAVLLAVAAAIATATAGTAIFFPLEEGTGYIALFPPLALAMLALRGLYQRRITVRLLEGLGKIVGATSLAAMSIVALAAVVQPEIATTSGVARAWALGTCYLLTGRVLLGLAQRRAREERAIGKPTLIVGAGQIGARVERRLDAQPRLGLRPVGYLDPDPAPASLVPERRAPVLGAPDDLARVAEETGAQHVILAFLSTPDSVLLPLVRECDERGLEVSVVPRMFESVNVRVALDHLGGLPLYGLRSVDPKGWQFTVKHTIDRLLAALLLVALGPLLLAVAIGVKMSSPGPVFFRQFRVGRDGHEFEILKFRTMFGRPEEQGEANAGWAAFAVGKADVTPIRPVERRTRIGKVLRAYSLDELPQLINVVKGDMSLVGPRPELPKYVAMFEESVHRYSDRHRVKSGLTGWAQVNGLRGNTSLSDRVEWDNWYVQNWSLSLDLQIMLMTATTLVKAAE